MPIINDSVTVGVRDDGRDGIGELKEVFLGSIYREQVRL